MSGHVLLSEIGMITDGGRRRRWTSAEKLRIVEETLDDRASISVVACLTYGYRRITAILNRQLCAEGFAPVSHKRVYRIMRAHNLLLARKDTKRSEHVHDGTVIVMRSAREFFAAQTATA